MGLLLGAETERYLQGPRQRRAERSRETRRHHADRRAERAAIRAVADHAHGRSRRRLRAHRKGYRRRRRLTCPPPQRFADANRPPRKTLRPRRARTDGTRRPIRCCIRSHAIVPCWKRALPCPKIRFAPMSISPARSFYLFVLEETASGALLGTSSIVASAGYSEPFYAFRNDALIHASRELKVNRKIHALTMSHELTGEEPVDGFLRRSGDPRGDA